MKKYLKALIVAELLSTSVLSYAAPLIPGEYQIQLYNDVKNNSPASTIEVCVKKDGSWDNGSPDKGLTVPWSGKWFNKGNDTHFQSFIKDNAVMSFNVSRINSKLSTGYYTSVINGVMQNMTMTLTYQSPFCILYDALSTP